MAKSGALVKAKLLIYKEGKPEEIPVQFNPSEYSISRSLSMSGKKANGDHKANRQKKPVSSNAARLSLTLYFDAYTPLKQGIGSKLSILKKDGGAPKYDTKVFDNFRKILNSIFYDKSLHTPPDVGFLWGEKMQFKGVLESCRTQYTMFTPDGKPVRMKVDLEISGEEIEIAQKLEANQQESPDRTKERLLRYGDQIWMVAEEEFKDPAQWKVIARENGILNPRAINRAVRLKVPSIR